MYQPPHFREERLDVQHALIRAHPLATLVTFGADGLLANHIPFLLDADASPLGMLKGHLARANAQWRSFDPAVQALVVFQGVAHYITPSWYETKRETGKVVPTWNYAVVHAWGSVRVVDDTEWLRAQVEALTGSQESGRAGPWAVTDAPEPFVASQLKGIIGLEIEIARIEGKWKVSQNRPEHDRQGVNRGLEAESDPSAPAMAQLVKTFSA